MAYRKIDTRIWNDEKFCTFSDKGKLVFLMLLTHPNMTSLGAMRMSPSGMAEEIGWDRRVFLRIFNELLASGVAMYDAKMCIVYLPNFLKYNRPESPNVVKSWAKSSTLLPESLLKDLAIAKAKDFLEGLSEGFRQAFAEEFAKAYLKPFGIQEQEQEQKEKNAYREGMGRGVGTWEDDEIPFAVGGGGR